MKFDDENAENSQTQVPKRENLREQTVQLLHE